jgi:hypothetical protein
MKVCERYIVKTSLISITCFILGIILVPAHSALAETRSKLDPEEYANHFKNVSEDSLNSRR